MAVEKVKTSVSLDKDVYEFIAKTAEQERTNVSQVINRKFYELMKAKEEGE